MTLNIGLITYGLDRPITGISRQTLELAKAFADFHTIPDFILLQTGDLGPLAEINTFQCAPLTSSRLLPGLMTMGQVSLNRAARRLALMLFMTQPASLLFLSSTAASGLL